ncbi:hypothetical protein D9O36_06005 [Zobellia amurskyensis]|uniref:Uncharacterized protein n=2 Tax=Zobellia amurskyensis TaxID=248905 RepID=A0A7X3D0V7_9FLAO|nr:hypothetical protein [Zobellia amurskyensis]
MIFLKKKEKEKKNPYNNILLENKWVLYNSKYNDGIVPEFNNLRSTNFTIKLKKNIRKNENFVAFTNYEYDMKGNIIKMIEEQFKDDELEKKIVREYKYVYDNRGNWTNKTLYYNGEKDSDIIRTILYK